MMDLSKRSLLLLLTLCMLFTPVKVRAADSCKQLALTFDDGPSIHTARLLDYMAEKGIHATFFLVGNRVSSYRYTVQRQAKDGHEQGYHSYAHRNQTTMTSERIFAEYTQANQELMELTGQEYTLWRCPGGAFNTRVLQAIPLPHVYWSADTRDWENKNSVAVRDAILQNACDGAIILLHDLYSSSVDGAIQAMEILLDMGYEFLTVSELLSRRGYPPKICINYCKD